MVRALRSLALLITVAALESWLPAASTANVNVVPGRVIEMPGSGGGGGGGGGSAGRTECRGNACVPSAVVVPWPVPATEVPWAQSVYWAPAAASSNYGRESLSNIDAYLAGQCLRSGNRQYYCKGSLNPQQIEWIQRLGQVQLQQTHIRWGDSWYVR